MQSNDRCGGGGGRSGQTSHSDQISHSDESAAVARRLKTPSNSDTLRSLVCRGDPERIGVVPLSCPSDVVLANTTVSISAVFFGTAPSAFATWAMLTAQWEARINRRQG
eukprot:1859453-Prymnesium_polylepis.2